VTVIHDRHALALALCFLHLMSCDEDGRADLGAEQAQPLPDGATRGGIEADSRLVEKEHMRAVEQGGRNLEPPQHPTRESARELTDEGLHAHRLDRVVDPRSPLAPWHSGYAGVELEVLGAGQSGVDRDRLRYVADLRAHADALAADVVTHDEGSPGGRLEQRREHAQRRGLAGAVGAE
jgi:hypothetical protein